MDFDLPLRMATRLSEVAAKAALVPFELWA